MLTTNANFDALHDLQYKSPLYLIQFEGQNEKYVNNYTTDGADNWQRRILQKITGHTATIKPEFGQSSIGGINAYFLNRGNEMSMKIASDPYQFDRKKATFKAGYVGMAEADLLTIATFWVSGITLTGDNLIYNFKFSDPQKWMQRNIFREASDSSTVTIQGNPLNILLSVLQSSGTGANGTHDYLAEENGLALDSDAVDVSRIENVRDKYYPGDSNYMKFVISERQKAKEFIEKQICQPLGMYPAIDGQGRFFVIPFQPPYDVAGDAQIYDTSNIIGIPQWDLNLDAKINEIYFYIDETDGDYTEHDYIDGTSVENRGAGTSPLKIKSNGLRSTLTPGSLPGRALDVIVKRKNQIFGRWSNPPPIKLQIKTLFSKWIAEAGDIIFVTHNRVPDLETGEMGINSREMEVVSRAIDWQAGTVRLDLLDTGFDKLTYGVIGAAGSNIGSFYIAP